MAAFRGAVEVGAHALEADLHLSKDGVIVLSHVRRHFPRLFNLKESLFFVHKALITYLTIIIHRMSP